MRGLIEEVLMRLRYSRYSLNKGVQKIKTRAALVLSALALAVGGGGLPLFLSQTAYAAETWNVSSSGGTCTTSDHSCSTIQSAINAASSGDTINVAAGTYTEQVLVNKQLTINGANVGISAGATLGSRVTESIVTGGFSIPATASTAAGTVIDGFTVQGGFLASPAFGFRVGDSSGGVSNVTIQNNIIENVTSPTQSNGIEVVAGSNNLTIKNNNINNNYRGIYLNPSDGITIEGNVIDSNNGVGVGIGSSGQSNLTISGNIISNNNVEGWGIDTAGTNVVANFNSFVGNGAGADWYGGTDNTINATCNLSLIHI